MLSAGFGTRLRPLTDECPKPLLPLGDRSLLEHALAVLERAGLGPDVLVNTHHLADEFEKRKASFSLDVRLVREPSIRGTAGGIAAMKDLFDPGPIVVLLPDVVLERIPPGFRESAADGGMVLAVSRRPRGVGTVGMNEAGEVVRLRGRVFGREATGGQYVGLMALGERTLHELPARGCYIADYAMPLLEQGGKIRAFFYEGSFSFAGDSLTNYLELNLSWLDHLGGAPYLGPETQVSPGVRLDRALVGAGACLSGEGIVRCSVIFPGARARAPLSRVIVTHRTVINIK